MLFKLKIKSVISLCKTVQAKLWGKKKIFLNFVYLDDDITVLPRENVNLKINSVKR